MAVPPADSSPDQPQPIDPVPPSIPTNDGVGEDPRGTAWINTVAERLFEGENLRDVLATVRDCIETRDEFNRERLAAHARMIGLLACFRLVVVVLVLVIFGIAGWAFRDDPEIVRLLIVSLVSFLGGAVAGSFGGWADGRGGRGGK